MRNWDWIKPVVLDVLSSPFLGPIGSCRTEALVSGGRGGRIFLFFVLAKKIFCMRVMSVLPGEGCKEPGQKGSSWGSGRQWTQIWLCYGLPRCHPIGVTSPNLCLTCTGRHYFTLFSVC